MGLERELKKVKLKDKKAMMVSMIVKIVLAVIILVLMFFVIGNIVTLMGLTNQLGEMQAKETILGLANKINLMEDGGTEIYPIYVPLGWTIVAFDKNTKVHDTFKVPSSLTFQNVICICKTGNCGEDYCQKIKKPLKQEDKLFLLKIDKFRKFFIQDEGTYYKAQEKVIDLLDQDVIQSDFLAGIKKDNSWEPFNSQDTEVTKYNTAYEGDFILWKNPDTQADGSGTYYCGIKEDKRMFYEWVKCVGSGLGINSQIYYPTTIKETKDKSEPYTECDSCEFGITSRGTNPTIGRTIAVDPAVITSLSYVYIEFDCGSVAGTKYKEKDCKTECEKWNKRVYVAEDAGGSVKGNHIDLYAGVGKERYEFIKTCIPSKAKLWISPTTTTVAKLREEDAKNFQAVV